jgi:hypothetical protein
MQNSPNQLVAQDCPISDILAELASASSALSLDHDILSVDPKFTRATQLVKELIRRNPGGADPETLLNCLTSFILSSLMFDTSESFYC